MKKTIAVLLLVSTVFVSKGQEQKSQYRIKAYVPLSYNLHGVFYDWDPADKWNINGIDLGLEWKRKWLRQEVQLCGINRESNVSSSDRIKESTRFGGFRIRYQVGVDFFKKSSSWGFHAGLGLENIYGFTNKKTDYGFGHVSYWKHQIILINPYVFTEFSYKLSRQWAVSLTPVYQQFYYGLWRSKQIDGQGNYSVDATTFIDKYTKYLTLRVGAAYTF